MANPSPFQSAHSSLLHSLLRGREKERSQQRGTVVIRGCFVLLSWKVRRGVYDRFLQLTTQALETPSASRKTADPTSSSTTTQQQTRGVRNEQRQNRIQQAGTRDQREARQPPLRSFRGRTVGRGAESSTYVESSCLPQPSHHRQVWDNNKRPSPFDFGSVHFHQKQTDLGR